MKLPRNPPSLEDLTRSVLGRDNIVEQLGYTSRYLGKVQKNYLHWNDLSHYFPTGQFNEQQLEILWWLAKQARTLLSRLANVADLSLSYVQTPWLEKTLHEVDTLIGGKFDPYATLPSALKSKYMVNSLMEEAIASSQLEGASTTRKIAKEMLRDKRKPKNKSEQMIYNNYLTMKFIKQSVDSNARLTIDYIKRIHKMVTEGTLEDSSYEGAFRKDNDIGVFDNTDNVLLYTPPDYKRLDELMDGVCKFANEESSDYYFHPIVKAIIIHYLIGYIHPFYDGNGRTARSLFYWYSLSQKYDYMEYIALSTAIRNAPAQYARAYLYSESDQNDVAYFVKFNLEKLKIAMNSFLRYVDRKKDENSKIIATLKHDRSLNLRQSDILINLNRSEGTFTIEEMMDRYDTTYQTARTDLLGLVRLGYMTKILVGKKFLFELDREKTLTKLKSIL